MEIITKEEIFEKGDILNNLHTIYKNTDGPRKRKQAWSEYIEYSKEYSELFKNYCKQNKDISQMI